jgi:hypothetical protein
MVPYPLSTGDAADAQLNDDGKPTTSKANYFGQNQVCAVSKLSATGGPNSLKPEQDKNSIIRASTHLPENDSKQNYLRTAATESRKRSPPFTNTSGPMGSRGGI